MKYFSQKKEKNIEKLLKEKIKEEKKYVHSSQKKGIIVLRQLDRHIIPWEVFQI